MADVPHVPQRSPAYAGRIYLVLAVEDGQTILLALGEGFT